MTHYLSTNLDLIYQIQFNRNIVKTHFLSTSITILVMTYQVQNNNKTSHDL